MLPCSLELNRTSFSSILRERLGNLIFDSASSLELVKEIFQWNFLD